MQQYSFNSKEYNKKIYKSPSVGGFAILIFFIIILIGVAFVLIKQTKVKKNEFYFVEINAFASYKDACNLANEIQAKQAAGYVYFNGTYHVLANFYPSKQDAQNVCQNLIEEYPNCKVFSIEYKKFVKTKNLTNAQANATQNLSNKAHQTIEQIYNNILAFDKAEINQTELKLNFEKIANDFSPCYNNFVAEFKENSKFNKAKTSLSEMFFVLGNLKQLAESNMENFRLKYNMTKFVVEYCNFLTCF